MKTFWILNLVLFLISYSYRVNFASVTTTSNNSTIDSWVVVDNVTPASETSVVPETNFFRTARASIPLNITSTTSAYNNLLVSSDIITCYPGYYIKPCIYTTTAINLKINGVFTNNMSYFKIEQIG